MGKIQYNKESGILHIGFGRFFYAQKPVEVKDEDELLRTYSSDLESVDTGDGSEGEDGSDTGPEEYTEASLKKLGADEQKQIIEDMGGDLEGTKNADDRIALILQLQEEQKESGE